MLMPNSRTALGLATITRNTIVPNMVGAPGWQQDAEPTPQQAKIIQLLINHTRP